MVCVEEPLVDSETEGDVGDRADATMETGSDKGEVAGSIPASPQLAPLPPPRKTAADLGIREMGRSGTFTVGDREDLS
jgi:hypothetical protein